jgi:AcrR family transcriptional regulator
VIFLRSRIIEEAIQETGEKGIKFTMDDLACRLGVSKRTIYENFRSKEELIDAIIDHFFSVVDKKEQNILNDPNLNNIEKLKAIAMILPNDFRLLYVSKFMEVKRYYPNQWKKIQRWLDDWRPEAKLIEEGIKNGRIRKVNYAVFRRIIIESTIMLLDKDFLNKNALAFKEALASMMDIILYGIVAK